MAEAQKISEQARPANPLVVLRDQMNSRLGEFKNALPPHISPERFARTAMTAIQMNPELAAVDRRSLWNSLMRAASDGLLPDGRQGAIVPFRDNNSRSPTNGQQIAVWMPMVAGLLTRFRNSGEFKAITADVVREGDTFRHWIDEHGEHLLHEPGDGGGKMTKAYAMASLKTGGTMIKVMSKTDIDKRRAVSKAKDGPMWKDWYDEAAVKTVLRNLTKLLPSSTDDLDRLMERDAEVLGFTPSAELPTERRERLAGGVASALDAFGGDGLAAGDAGGNSSDPDAPPIQPLGPDASGKEPETGTATGAQDAASGDGSANPPSPVETARQRGSQARAEKVQRRAIPPEYREPDRKAEADAWFAGWDGDPE